MSVIVVDQPTVVTVVDDSVSVVTAGTQGPSGPTGATGPGVQAGGTTGQVLAKNSNANYDTTWVAPSVSKGFAIAMAVAL